jgi:hypothetical protein
MKSLRILKFVTVLMGVLIIAGTTVLGVTIVKRLSEPTATTRIAATLDEPEGTRIASIAATQDRLALHLQGGGPDRVVLLDPRTGTRTGSVSLAH